MRRYDDDGDRDSGIGLRICHQQHSLGRERVEFRNEHRSMTGQPQCPRFKVLFDTLSMCLGMTARDACAACDCTRLLPLSAGHAGGIEAAEGATPFHIHTRHTRASAFSPLSSKPVAPLLPVQCAHASLRHPSSSPSSLRDSPVPLLPGFVAIGEEV